LNRIVWSRKGAFLNEPLTDQAFLRGEEARSGGAWAYPETWGTRGRSGRQRAGGRSC